MLRCLVTGGKGFIGSHLVNYLKSQGYYVINADIVRESFLETKEDLFYQVDLRNPTVCEVITQDVDWVFNLAANMGGIGYITKIGADIMRDNTMINLNMLEACRKNNVKRIFFSSSACVYPEYLQETTEVKPLKECDAFPAAPDQYYGWEKLYAELLMEAYHKDYGIDIRIARFHNIYGEYGTYEGGKEKAPAALCRKVAKAKDGDSIIIWGDGNQTRSFCHVDDAVRGILMLMKSNYTKPVNIGSDRLVTINELAQMIIDISGKKLTITHDLTKPQGVRGRNADLTLVKKVIGWEPKITLEEGLRRTYRWIYKQIHGRDPFEEK